MEARQDRLVDRVAAAREAVEARRGGAAVALVAAVELRDGALIDGRVEIEFALQHDLAAGGHLERHVRAGHERHGLAEQRTRHAQLVLAACQVETRRHHQRRMVADRDRDRQPPALLARGACRDREVVVRRDADERSRAAERSHARDRPVALARLGIARHDAPGRDVPAALLLEEARDRQLREVGVARDDLLAGTGADDCRSEGSVEGAYEQRPQAVLVGAERLADQRAAREQVRDERQRAATYVRDADRLAVVRHQRGGDVTRRIELPGDLDQPPAGREAAEPRSQRLGLSRHRERPIARARRRRCGRARSTRRRRRRRSARAAAGGRSACRRRVAHSRAHRRPGRR